jgi:hypothetical protein
MRRRLLLLTLISTLGCVSQRPLTPSGGSWRFSGTVFRMQGNQVGSPIAGARLTVVDGVNLNASATTDGSGHYAFEALEHGKFTIAIEAAGFLTATPLVNLYRDIEATFALKPQ